MVSIATATFAMGAENDQIDERPVRMMLTAGFCMDRLEVTVRGYLACVQEGRCQPAPAPYAKCNVARSGREDHPMNCVSWQEARAFCDVRGKRLPTEQEWELAARGSAGRLFPWGAEAPGSRICWNGPGNAAGHGSRNETCAVGSHPAGATPEGLQDLVGNVWEWTESRYCRYSDPGCSATARINRGGGWFNDKAESMRATRRDGDAPEYRSESLGFRCAAATRL